MPEMLEQLQAFLGAEVVVDTSSTYIFLGRLAGVDDYFISLEDVDVHDAQETSTTKEVYCLEARRFGIKKNRRRVLVRLDKVISISALDDIIEY